MTEENADSPAKRIYFVVQMMPVSDKERQCHSQRTRSLEAVPSSTPILLDIGRKVIEGNLYGAMKACKKLMRYEEEVLKHVTQ